MKTASLILFLFLVGFSSAPQPIRDQNSHLIGYLQTNDGKTVVRDCNYRYLGYSDKTGTYDESSRKVLQSEAPAILLKKGCNK